MKPNHKEGREQPRTKGNVTDDPAASLPLTGLQRNLIELLADEVPDKQIAHLLGLSRAGVGYRLDALRKRFDRRTRTGIVAQHFRELLGKRLGADPQDPSVID